MSQESRRVRAARTAAVVLAGVMISTGQGATLTFQEGVNGYAGTVDTFLKQASPGTSFGGSVVVEWDGEDAGGQNIGLLRFDHVFGVDAGQIQPTDTITSATLSYEVINPGHDATVNEVVVDWDETTTYNNFGGDAGVQSDEYGAQVGMAGGATGTRTLNVTSSIAAWTTTPSLNKGWIFRPTGGTDGVEFRSSEDATATLRPRLTVVVNEGDPPPAIVTRGPYLQLVTSSSIVVRWRTDNATDSRVRYGTSQGSLTNEVTGGALKTEHELTITDLSASTQYYYDVGTTTRPLAGGTADHFFHTSPVLGSTTPVRVWAIGDFGTADTHARNVRDAYYSDTGSDYTDVWLMLGDNAYENGTEGQYQAAVFDTYQDLLIQTPFWATRGNHEQDAGVHYGLVTNPTGGEAGGLASGSEAYFSFDYANIHFICLDSYATDRSPGGAMMTWLANDLASTNQLWIIAFWHHPPYTKGTYDSDDLLSSGGRTREMRENALPILEAGGCDLVLTGHSHVYERSYLIDGHYGTSDTLDPGTMFIDGGDGRTDGDGAYIKQDIIGKGTVYVVMGSSGKLGSGPLNHPVMYLSLSQRGSFVLDIDGNALNGKMIRDDGVMVDYLTINKTPPGPLIELSDTLIERTVPIFQSLPNDVFTVANGGVDTLNYSISDDADWLDVSPASGSSTGEPDSIDLIYDVSSLLGGVYEATVTVTSAEAVNSPQTLTVRVTVKSVGPDFDGDGDVDMEDHGHLQACFSGTGVGQSDPNCQNARLDDDADVDQADYQILKGCLSGANVLADMDCDDLP